MKKPTSPQKRPSKPNFDIDFHLKELRYIFNQSQLNQIRKHHCAENLDFFEAFISKTGVGVCNDDGNLLAYIALDDQKDSIGRNLNAFITCTTLFELEKLDFERRNKIISIDYAGPLFQILWAAFPSISRAELMGILDYNPNDWTSASWAVFKMVSEIKSAYGLLGFAEGPRYSLKSDAIREVIRLRFVVTHELEVAAHAKIANYFLKALRSAAAPLFDYGRTNLVKHFVLSGNRDGVTEVLSDLRYLESRICAKEVDAVLEDFAMAGEFLADSPSHLQRIEACRRLFASNRAALTIEASAEERLVQIAYNDSPSGPLRVTAEKALEGKSPVEVQKIHAPRPIMGGGVSRGELESELSTEIPIPLLAVISCVTSMVFSPKGDRGFVGKENGTLEVWDSMRSECVKVLEGHKNKIADLQISPCGKRLVSSSEKELRVWDVERDICIFSLEDESISRNHHVQITSDSKRFVTAGSIFWCVWDMESGDLLLKINGHEGAYSSIKVSNDDKHLLTSCYLIGEEGPKIWDMATGECLQALIGTTDGVLGTDASGDFNYVFSVYDDYINLWNGITGELIKSSYLFNDQAMVPTCWNRGKRSIHIALDARTVLVCHTRRLLLWDLETLETIQEFCGHDTMPEVVSMRPDGKFVVYLDGHGFLQMKRSDGTLVFEVLCCDAEIFTIDWDKGCLAVGYTDGRVEFHQSTLSVLLLK